jgi:hypothetical protein
VGNLGDGECGEILLLPPYARRNRKRFGNFLPFYCEFFKEKGGALHWEGVELLNPKQIGDGGYYK